MFFMPVTSTHICICIHIRICSNIHKKHPYTYTYNMFFMPAPSIHIRICMHTRHTCTHTRTPYTHTHIYTHWYARIHATCTYTHTPYMAHIKFFRDNEIHSYIHTHMHACIHTYTTYIHAYVRLSDWAAWMRNHSTSCMYACMYACVWGMYVCISWTWKINVCIIETSHIHTHIHMQT